MYDVHITVGLRVDQILPAVNYAFPQKNSSHFACALCVGHIHIRCWYRTSQIFSKNPQLNKIVLKRVEENAKTK